MHLQQLFDNLWTQYVKESPQVQEIYDHFIKSGETVVNDHIAFRTFNDPRIGLSNLAKFFEQLGYVECGEYFFEDKSLYAKHFEHKSDHSQPLIFISELEVQKFSPYMQELVKKLVDKIPTGLINSPHLLFSGSAWGELDYDVYQKLLLESEYAAWLYVFGFRANHFTVLVNALKKLTSLTKVNGFLKESGFILNASGGEIKGTPEQLLEQSSTMANEVPVKFKQGTFNVLNSFYEFAKRYPKADGKLYTGFIAASADKLFESTYVSNT